MADLAVAAGLALAERALAPDPVIRVAIRAASRYRLRTVTRAFGDNLAEGLQAFVERLDEAAIAESTEEANEQHYELPNRFFELVLGPRRKYSCCEWTDETRTLADAENRALATYATRGQLADGQRILDMGCGWGSLSLYLGRRYPNASILGVSNSATQREFILSEAKRQGLKNVQIETADINTFEPGQRFDRIVSIEMLEHVRNHRALFARIAEWLEPDGLAFFHVFRHRNYPYTFETEGSGNWMGRYFFTGGVMPSDDLLPAFQDALTLVDRWQWDGTHYEKTANAWLEQLDVHRREILAILAKHYGTADAAKWVQRWRIFFMACAEMFGLDDGQEWGVSHYLFTPGG